MGVVVVRLQHGLGNQLFQFAAGLAAARRRRTQLILDLQFFAQGLGRPFGLHTFAIKALTHGELVGRAVRNQSPSIRGRLTQWAMRRLRFHWLIDAERGYDPRIFETPGNVYLDGYWQSERYFTGVSHEIRQALACRPPPYNKLRPLIGQLRGEESVAVHIRRGDYASDAGIGAVHGCCDVSYYRRAVGLVRQLISRPRFYIFSDDVEWCHRNLDLGWDVIYITHGARTTDQDDLRLMAACRHAVIANSTFSWWGAWLAHHGDQVVVAPARWFADPSRSAKDRVPDRWLKV